MKRVLSLLTGPALLLSLSLLAVPACAQQWRDVLKNGDFSQGMEGWSVWPDNGIANFSVVDAQAGPHRKALHVEAKPNPGAPVTDISAFQNLEADLPKGLPVKIKVWLRSPDHCRLGMKLTSGAYDGKAAIVRETLELEPQWKQYEFNTLNPSPMGSHQCRFSFYFGYQPGIVEIAGVQVQITPYHPLLDLQIGHSDWIVYSTYSPDGKHVASRSNDGTIKLWDAQDGTLLNTFATYGRGHRKPAFSPNSRLLAAGVPGRIKIWDVKTGTRFRTLHFNNLAERHTIFLSDSQLLSASADDKNLQIWDMKTGQTQKEIATDQKIEAVTVAKQTQLVATAESDNVIRVRDLASGQLKKTLSGHEERIYEVAFFPDGKRLVSGGADNVTRIWDVEKGIQLRAIPPTSNFAHGVAVAPDGQTVARTETKFLRFINVEKGVIKDVPNRGSYTSIEFRNDGTEYLASGFSRSFGRYDFKTGVQKLRFSGGSEGQQMCGAVLSPDKKLVATSNWDSVKVWDIEQGRLLHTFVVGKEQERSVAFLPDNRTLIAAGSHDLRLWDVQTGKLLANMSGEAHSIHMALSPDAMQLACANHDGKVRVWTVNPKSEKPFSLLRTMEGGHQGFLYSVAFSPDSKHIASGGHDKKVFVWDAQTGAKLHELTESKSGIYAVGFSPDGKWLASNDGGTTYLYDARTFAFVKSLGNYAASENLSSLHFSSDSKKLISCGVSSVLLWDLVEGKHLRSIACGYGAIPAGFVSPDIVAVGTGDGVMRLYDWRVPVVQAAREIAAMVPLATSATDPNLGAVAQDGQQVRNEAEEYLTYTPEGYYRSSPQADRFMRFKVDEISYPAECFQKALHRPDMVEKALEGEKLPLFKLKGQQPPLLSFISPPPGSTLKTNTATFTVDTVDDTYINNVTFFVNGSRAEAKISALEARPLTSESRSLEGVGNDGVSNEVSTNTAIARPITAGSRDALLIQTAVAQQMKQARRFTATIALPADVKQVRVAALAFDEDELQSPRQEMLLQLPKVDQGQVQRQRLLGLCVGVSEYAEKELNLRFAHADAMALGQQLEKQKKLYQQVGITVLTNQKATAVNIKAALDNLLNQVSKQDTVVLLLSGHGWRANDERTFYFASHEVQTSEELLPKTALPWSEVVQRLTQLSEKSRRVIVFLDTCHSGSAATNEEMVKAILGANAGVIIFSSSAGHEVSYEREDWGHGAFTKALLEAAEGKAARKGKTAIPLWDVVSYVRDRVQELTDDQQNPQVPFLQNFDLDSPLIAIDDDTGPR